ncbi:MAG: hypothetical protein VZQ83_02110 [Eubacterium sp.]|nr:hypothetical protein [Eubacterium sp.]
MKKKQLIIWLVLAMVLNMLGVVPTITNEPNTAYAAEDDDYDDLDDDSDNDYMRTHTPTPKPYETSTPTPEEEGWPAHVVGEYHRNKTDEKGYIYEDGSYVTESGLLEGVFDLSAIIKGAKKTDYTFYKIPSWVKTIGKGALNSPVIKDECRILTIPSTVKKICAGALDNVDGFNDRCVDVTFTQTTWDLTNGAQEVYRERPDKYGYEDLGEFSDEKYRALHTIRFETGDCEMVTGCIDTSWDLTIVAPTDSNAYKYAQVYGYWFTSSEEVQPLRKKVDTLVDMHEALNLANAPARVYWSVEGKDKDKVFIHGATGHFFAVRPCKVTIVAKCDGKRYEIPATFKKRTVKKVRKYITDYVGKNSADGVKLFYLTSYVNHHCVYDGANWGGLVCYYNKDPRKYTKEGVYIDSKAVCDGMSKFCLDICNYWGIPCKRKVSYKQKHAWNVIKLNGKWQEGRFDLTKGQEWVRHPGAIKHETVKERIGYVIDTYDGTIFESDDFIKNTSDRGANKGIFNNDGKIRNTYVNPKNWKNTPLLKK